MRSSHVGCGALWIVFAIVALIDRFATPYSVPNWPYFLLFITYCVFALIVVLDLLATAYMVIVSKEGLLGLLVDLLLIAGTIACHVAYVVHFV